MLKINKSILIICMISLFLIIGQISASDTDLIKINDSDTSNYSTELIDMGSEASILDINMGEELNDSILYDKNNYESDESDNKNLIKQEDPNESDNKNLIKQEDPNESDNKNLIKQEDSNEQDKENESVELIEEKVKDTNGVVMANDNFSCGPASLATVLNRYGLNLSLNQVSKHTNTSLNGTSMQSLIEAARYYNFNAYGVEIDTQNLKENYIVHLNINGCQHWSVITKVTDTHVFLADSTEGNMNFTINEFNSYFTKKAIVLSNNTIDLKEQIISNQISILNQDQCLKISGKGLKKKVIGYRIVWKYGLIQKYGWVLRPKVVGGHVSFSQWQYVKGYYTVWGKYKVKEPIYKYYFVNDESLTSAKIKK